MIGAGSAIPLLLVGALIAWWRLRNALSSAWSREGRVVGGDEAPYRQSPQRLPVPGAGPVVVALVAYVYAMGFVGVCRIALTWVAIIELIDFGHIQAHLVPADLRGVVMQFALAADGLAIAILLPRAAGSIARRSVELTRAVRWAGIAAGLGVGLALADAWILYQATDKPVIYWIAGMLVDDVAYALLGAAAVGALAFLDRASKRAPPVAPAAVDRGVRSKLPTALAVAGAILSAALLTHAVLYARHRVQVSREIEGEVPVSIDGAKARRSADGRFSIWMPEDSWEDRESRTTPQGTVEAVRRNFERSTTSLTFLWFDRAAGDARSIEDLCREAKAKRGGAVIETSIGGGGDHAWCEIVEERSGQRHIQRVVVEKRRIYELDATPIPSPAADFFIESFRTHPKD